LKRLLDEQSPDAVRLEVTGILDPLRTAAGHAEQAGRARRAVGRL